MKLRRQNAENPRFEELNEMVQAMKDLLVGNDTRLTIEEVLSFQSKDGSFGLFETYQIPHEAIIDYVNKPTYLATSILMKEYLKGTNEIEESLIKGLNFTYKSGLRGHGYEDERIRIESLMIFIEGGLQVFLEKEKEICPRFHRMIHNIIYKITSNLKLEKTHGVWGEDYTEAWKGIIDNLRLEKRFYAAYGSNMSKKQMLNRCPDAKPVGKAYLKNKKLTMPHYANIETEVSSKVPVYIWEITSDDEKNLDRYEGYPNCYDKEELIVSLKGVETTAMVYVMTDERKNKEIIVREGYAKGIIQGYRDAGFSEDEFQPR